MKEATLKKEMSTFAVHPQIVEMMSCDIFLQAFHIGEGDLIFTSGSAFHSFLEGKTEGARVLLRGNYGKGEPSDEMVESIYQDIKDYEYKRVIAIGGGSVLDVAKLFALKQFSPVLDLFDRKLDIVKDKELILIPTTCGTGSEVTNISILELRSRHTKLGLAVDELYADYAVLIPELLNDLPMKFFATSSIDALIHSFESFTSPKANDFTAVFSLKAIEKILKGYLYIVEHGEESRKRKIDDFLIASTYAGIAFGNAGCAAVHALSYPLGANYHVPHGEANYVFFTQVYKRYMELAPQRRIEELNRFVAETLGCGETEVYEEIENLLGKIISKKSLKEYGMKPEEIEGFTQTVMEKQTRLMNNNYTTLTAKDVKEIYQALYE